MIHESETVTTYHTAIVNISTVLLSNIEINSTNDSVLDNDTTVKQTIRRGRLMDSGILSEEDYNTVRDIRSKLGLPLALSGCVLNVLTIIVYARMPPSFVNKYLIGLQVLDSLFLLCTFYPFFLIWIHGPSAGHTRSYQLYAIYVNNYLYSSLQRANVFCTAVLSVNRCIVMLAPFNQFAKKIFKHPVLIISILPVITLTTSIFVPLRNRVIKINMPDGSERYTLTRTDVYISHSDIFDQARRINAILFTYIPAIGSFVANICLVVGLIVITRRKTTAGNPESKKFFKMDYQKTMVVLVYSSLSLLLLMPLMSLYIIPPLVPSFGPMKKEHYMYISMGSIVAICDILRSAMGFFVFMGLSRVFRDTFIAIVLRRKVSKIPEPGNETTATGM